MKIKNKKILYLLVPMLVSTSLIGCSKKEVSTTQESASADIQNVVSEEALNTKSSYSDEFKENFLKAANHYNSIDEYLDTYNEIKWDEEGNTPKLPDDLIVTNYNDNEISLTHINDIPDEAVDYYKLNNEIIEISKKMGKLIGENTQEYKDLELKFDDNLSKELENKSEVENTQEYKDLELKFNNLSKELESKSEALYNSLYNETNDSDKKDNYTVMSKCLAYSILGGGEKVNDSVSQTFDTLGLLVSVASMAGGPGDNNELDLLFNNFYICDSEDENTVYGKISYNNDIDLDNKKIEQTFTIKKYTPEMDSEIKEFKEKFENENELE